MRITETAACKHAAGRRVQVSKDSRAGRGLRDQGLEDRPHGQESVAAIPVMVEPVEAEIPLRVAPVETRHVAVASNLRRRTEGNDRELALLAGIRGAIGEQPRKVRRHPWPRRIIGRNQRLQFPRSESASEVEELVLHHLHDTGFGFHDREVLRGDIGMVPVETAGGDHLGEALGVVDREGRGGQGAGPHHEITKCAELRDFSGLDALHQGREVPVMQRAEIIRGWILLTNDGQRMIRLTKGRVFFGIAHRKSPMLRYSLRVANASGLSGQSSLP